MTMAKHTATELLEPIIIENLNNISIQESEIGFVVALVDDVGIELVRGYGNSPEEALNELHRNLI